MISTKKEIKQNLSVSFLYNKTVNAISSLIYNEFSKAISSFRPTKISSIE
jgi:ADP-dependent phosphofructokinase/glucokinase